MKIIFSSIVILLVLNAVTAMFKSKTEMEAELMRKKLEADRKAKEEAKYYDELNKRRAAAKAHLDQKVKNFFTSLEATPINYGLHTPCKRYDVVLFTPGYGTITADDQYIVPEDKRFAISGPNYVYQPVLSDYTSRGYGLVAADQNYKYLQKCIEFYPRPDVPQEDLLQL
jgi:hypothetical protein